MQELSLTVNDILTRDNKIVFLTGSGCSTYKPSCLVEIKDFMKTLLDFACDKHEVDKILELEDFKFEHLVEILRHQIDKDLKIFDFFDLCDKPNSFHYFLAKKILEGNFVLTTNFDLLIERALLNSGATKENVTLAITEKDFEKFQELCKQDKNKNHLLCKLIGSTKNLITNENTKQYLASIINKIGGFKDNASILEIEGSKKVLLENVLSNSTLIVLGFSAVKDNCISSMLKNGINVNKIVWFNHIENQNGREKIYEILDRDIKASNGLSDLDKYLVQIKSHSPQIQLFRVDVNAKTLIEGLLDPTIKIGVENFNIDLLNWLNEKIKIPNDVKKFVIPHIIYFNFNRYDDALKTGEKALTILDRSKDVLDKLLVMNNIGWIYFSKGNYSEAINRFHEALLIAGEMGDSKSQIIFLNNLGEIYEKVNDYQEALKYYDQSLGIAEDTGDLTEKLRCINFIVDIHEKLEHNDEAIKWYDKAIKIAESLNDLSSKAIYLNNLAAIHYKKGDYPSAAEFFKASEKIVSELNDNEKLAIHLNNIGVFYQNNKEYQKALEKFDEALYIDELSGNLKGKMWRLNKIGCVYQELKKYSEALMWFKMGLYTSKKLKDIVMIGAFYNAIGKTYFFEKNFTKAIVWFRKALRKAIKANDLLNKADYLNNIAGCYFMKQNYKEALKNAEESLQDLRLLGFGSSYKANNLRSKIQEIKQRIVLSS